MPATDLPNTRHARHGQPGTQTTAVARKETVSDPRHARSICVAIALAVGTTLKVPAFLFFSPSRGTGPIAFARHVAMYIAHVELALPMQRVGEGFGRDRTTVAHACRRIEESREAVEIDRMIVAVRGQVLAELTQQDEGSVPIKQGAPTNAGSQS